MRRGQAALEFLTTYGWSLLFITLVLGTMAFFGVLHPDLMIPQTCRLEHLNCEVVGAWSNGTLMLRLQNNHWQSLHLQDAACTYRTKNVQVVTKTFVLDGKPLSEAGDWHLHEFRTLQCRFDGDNPFAGKTGRKRHVAVTLQLETPGGPVTLTGPVTVLVG